MGEFDASKEDWTSYTERLQQYFAANDIPEEKQRAVLLSSCGPQTYNLLKSVLAPEKPTDKSFVQIVQLMKDQSLRSLDRKSIGPVQIYFQTKNWAGANPRNLAAE